MPKTDRHFLVTISDVDVFCAEVTLARVDPEIVVGSPMVRVEREEGDDLIDMACWVLRDVLEDEDAQPL